MEYSYRFRLYPTREQESLIQRTFGCCRYVYNCFLAERIDRYKETGKSPTKYRQMRKLPEMKQKFEWLKEVDSTALQASTEVLSSGYSVSKFLSPSESRRETGLSTV